MRRPLSGAPPRVAIVGTGPAGLMAAHVLARAGARVTLFEKKKGPGRKLLVAGSSGLNVTYDAAPGEFAGFYRGPRELFEKFLGGFSPEHWLEFIHELDIKTFKGTSRRYFVEGLKASGLLRAWLQRLASRGVVFSYNRELVDFESRPEGGVALCFANGETFECDAAVLALGGGSWESAEKPLRFPALFERKGLAFSPFTASNVGYEVSWPQELLKELEGQPLKNVTLTTSRGSKRGDLVVTSYGLEGTPVYYLGVPGEAGLDLKPDLSAEQILKKLSGGKENRSPLKRVKKSLGLGPAAFELVARLTPKEKLADLEATIAHVKALSFQLTRPRPLDEAISSAGGLCWAELDDQLMLRKFPGVYACGELLDWDAPTGGFLIQGCVSQGHYVGTAVAHALKAR